MNDIMKCNFVVTKDEEAKDVLLQKGLTLVSSLNGLFIFINEPKKMQFNFDNLHIRFTNKLYF